MYKKLKIIIYTLNIVKILTNTRELRVAYEKKYKYNRNDDKITIFRKI